MSGLGAPYVTPRQDPNLPALCRGSPRYRTVEYYLEDNKINTARAHTSNCRSVDNARVDMDLGIVRTRCEGLCQYTDTIPICSIECNSWQESAPSSGPSYELQLASSSTL